MAETLDITVLLLGDPACGKSTFLSKISQGNNGISRTGPITLLRDIDQPFNYDVTLYGRRYKLRFYDVASPAHWSQLRPDVVVLCYDIHNRLSLINLRRLWLKEATTYLTQYREIPVLMLGLKRDLRSEEDPNGIIYPQEGHRVAQELRCDKYMECSAFTGELVHQVFEDICKTAAMTTTEKGGMSEGGCGLM